MASIKKLKKQLHCLFEDLMDECLLYLVIHPEMKAADIGILIRELDTVATRLRFQLNHCRYKPKELSAKQFVNLSVADAREKLDELFAKLTAIR